MHILFLKTHIDSYTKKDGTFVAAHEDRRSESQKFDHAKVMWRKTNGNDPNKVEIRDGKFVIHHPGVGFSTPHETLDKFIEGILNVPKEPNVFFRFTNNKNEASIAKRGELRNSKNHAENFHEKGVSVADGPHYSVQGYKYGYKLTGNVVGHGSDGEPLLDPKSIRVLTPIKPSSHFAEEGWEKIKRQKKDFLEKNKMHEDYFDKVVKKHRWLLPDGVSPEDLREYLIDQTLNLKGPLVPKNIYSMTRNEATKLVDAHLSHSLPTITKAILFLKS